MKKVLFAVALVMGLGSSVAFANNMASDVEIVAMVNEFKPIDIKELPQAVQGTPSRKTMLNPPLRKQP